MDRRDVSGKNVEGGFDSPLYDKDLRDTDAPPAPCNEHSGQKYKMPRFNMPQWSRHRVATGALVLLAAILFIVDVSLGIHYHKLKDSFFRLNDTERITSEHNKLKYNYSVAAETIIRYKEQLAFEQRQMKQSNWELEHHERRSRDYETQLDKVTVETENLRYRLPMIVEGCRRCPSGWILMNSMCYFFSVSETTGYISFKQARSFCQAAGGDLLILDSKDKENTTVSYLRSILKGKEGLGFWIGLKDSHEEGTWRWLNGKKMVEGYWKEGEPNDINDEDCAAVYPAENFFMAWNDVQCNADMKWICEKTPS